MVNVEYLLLRLARRAVPGALFRFLLRHRLVVRPGLETTDPAAAAARYVAELERQGRTVAGKTVMDFGYGGFFGTAVELLRRGARHVLLCDRFAAPDDRHNTALLAAYGDLLRRTEAGIRPDPERITLIHEDVRDYARRAGAAKADVVLSSSVFEHIRRDEIDSTTAALRALTAPGGLHVHFIDLRDHFFKYPFEMLCYSEAVWTRFLNPDVNLNRCRVPDYLRLFERHFGRVEWRALETDPEAYRAVRERIRPEFRSGDEALDAVMQMVVVAWAEE